MSNSKDTLDNIKEIVRDFNENFDFFNNVFSKSSIYPEFTVNGNFPIVWFGDLPHYLSSPTNFSPKIVTIGANPSNAEFNINTRFNQSKKAEGALNEFNKISTNTIDEEISFFNNYFTLPFHKRTAYFDRLEDLLAQVFFGGNNDKKNISFNPKSNYSRIIHIDAFSAIATTPLWGKLKSDSNTPTIADILAFANQDTKNLFNQEIDICALPKFSGIELENRLLKELKPDITLFMGTFNYFEKKLVHDFTKNSDFSCYSDIDYISQNTSKERKNKTLSEQLRIEQSKQASGVKIDQPTAALYVKKAENSEPEFLLFKRNAQSNKFYADKLTEVIKLAADDNNKIFPDQI